MRYLFRLLPPMAVFVLFASTSPVSAFDGKRQGFFIGLGIGPGTFSADVDYRGYYRRRQFDENGSSISSDLKLGAGSGENLQIYWSSKANWALDKRTDFIGSAGIGARYFFSEETPSLFFAGVFGYNTWSGLSERKSGGAESSSGPGWSISAGYEFTKNWELEVSGLIGSVGGNPSSDFRVVRVTIGHVWQ